MSPRCLALRICCCTRRQLATQSVRSNISTTVSRDISACHLAYLRLQPLSSYLRTLKFLLILSWDSPLTPQQDTPWPVSLCKQQSESGLRVPAFPSKWITPGREPGDAP